MAYWWVNHKQTRTQEVGGGYLWSPKRNQNGAFNQTYENMTRAEAGDVVFSYANGAIGAIGRVRQPATSEAKPSEFGSAGENWSQEGWLVRVDFEELDHPLSPKVHIDRIAPLLPSSHSPIRADGNGNQGVYLAEISPRLGDLLLGLIGQPSLEVNLDAEREAETERDLAAIQNDRTLTETERAQLSKARIGQGLSRQRVIAIEKRCRVTGVDAVALLRASHIKPWRTSNSVERLDGDNGLLLAPHVDLLFDRGLISFGDDGRLLLSPRLPTTVLDRWGLSPTMNVGPFNASQRAYLGTHRSEVFLAGL